MRQFENIETRVLIEILAENTEKFTQLFRVTSGSIPAENICVVSTQLKQL